MQQEQAMFYEARESASTAVGDNALQATSLVVHQKFAWT